MQNKPITNRDRIYAVVKRIPKGQVASYGQVARLAGLGGHARQVGYALHALPSGSRVPWHRVINALGRISQRSETVSESIQREMLEKEGIVFEADGRISMTRYRWQSSDP